MYSIISKLCFQENENDELEELQRQSEMPLEDLLKSLPPEVLEKPAEIKEPKVRKDGITFD